MLIVIPARGGSKGIPGKNIRILGGKPLINYTIETARKITSDENILVSTDSEEIKYVAEKTGLKVPFLRPLEFATDTAGTYEVILHALRWFEEKGTMPDKILLLQPTSPFRKVDQIKDAIDLYKNTLDMVVSVKETSSNPYYVLKEENEEGFLVSSKNGSFERRQDCPKVWELNGAIYIINVKSLKEGPISGFKKIKKYVMDEITSVDIDTELDWLIAEKIIESAKTSGCL